MQIDKQLSDNAVLAELGERIARQRIDRELTQARLAEQAGIAKRTLERMEAGSSAQLSSLIRVLRALNLLESLDALIPGAGPGPLDWLKRDGKRRQRASSRAADKSAAKSWSWDGEE